MEALTIAATIFAMAGTVTTAFLAYLVLRIRVETHESSERMRREVGEQLKEMRVELNANVRERFEGLEHEVNKLRERMHEVGNKLQALTGWVEQSRSNHERIRAAEDRIRDLERPR
jgi:septal ring factor EnvC (AmiA/AmiB activator)